ncbi:hypothetical protein PTKIN_Ptkin09bG0051700 [Pterospermum kingtungense]
MEEIVEEEVAEKPVRPVRSNSWWFYSAKNMDKAKEAHLLVAILIATVTFAAAITVPGGYKGDNSEADQQGYPFLIRNVAFQIFIISNAFAFVLSSTINDGIFHLNKRLNALTWQSRQSWWLSSQAPMLCYNHPSALLFSHAVSAFSASSSRSCPEKPRH